MNKLLIAIISAAIGLGAIQTQHLAVLQKKRAGGGGGGGGGSEGFEGTGVPAGWTIASYDPDDTSGSPAEGSQDLKMTGLNSSAHHEFTALPDSTAYFAFKTFSHPAAGVTIFSWSATGPSGLIHNADGTLTVQYKGGVTATTVDAVPSFSWVYIKVRITPTQVSAEFSATKTFTGSGNAYAITASDTGGDALDTVWFSSSTAAGGLYFIDDVVWGSGAISYP